MEQGASTSRVAAGTFVNTISRLHGVAEEANDAVQLVACLLHVGTPRLLRSPQKESHKNEKHDRTVEDLNKGPIEEPCSS